MPRTPGEHSRIRWEAVAITPATLLRARFTGLTVVLLFLLICMNAIPEQTLREMIVGVGFSVFLGFAIWTVGKRLRVATLGLALPTLLSHWTLQLSNSLTLRAIGFGFTSAFLGFMTLIILIAVFRDETVTADTLVGAVCAYFLMGVTWGTWFTLVALVSPEAFSISPTLAKIAKWGTPTAPFTPLMQYYSFTTLATLGYGDVTPLSAGARVLSVIEGITGQLYLAVLIARLVGMHSARSIRQ